MTIVQIRETFSKKIIGVEEEEIILLPNAVTVELAVFVDLFENVNPSYAELVQADEGKGYIPFFEQCKAEGILN